MNSYPRRLLNDGREVVDEMCACGHRRTSHADRNAYAQGHGNCLRIGCHCARFTWTRWVFARRGRSTAAAEEQER